MSKSLRVGDLLKGKSGEWKPILSIEKVAETKATYNFEVEKNHDYFVGENGWLVHNTSIPVGELKPLHTVETSGTRSSLEKLTDNELLESVRNPINKDPIRINTKTGKIMDGNGRAFELLRRAKNPASTITPKTRVPFEPYTPDDSMFRF